MTRSPRILCLLLAIAALRAAPWVRETGAPDDFPLVARGKAATIVAAPTDHAVVTLAAGDLANDVARVTGVRPAVAAAPLRNSGPLVVIGTLGHSPVIDDLMARGRLSVPALAGAWECFIITTVLDPFPGVPQALVIVGSDRRGTAFGVYELSQAIGISPWHWWADVVPDRKASLHVAAGTRRFGPPSVKYRGIFLNDEDWGLQPWAAKTFEPENGGIGPKTYARVFELLLRLKANTLWPAMHACSKPFNADPRNAQLADRYAIVMGSSHAEPMLRNNVGEWTAPKEDYNYVTHRAEVRAYWEERVRTNGRFENLYTLGMRGIHDSNLQGPKTDPERIAVLEQVFADQQALLARHVRPDVAALPRMFCAYKEVLDLYRQGLRVPGDVTIVWPDDNYGYVRDFATPAERARPGGFGVYYHLSYLGRPLAYLWLNTTPPALIWEEMTKAYAHGADRIWIANVGDLKPAELGTEFFLQLAWDVHRWPATAQPSFLAEWADREFGPDRARDISGVMTEYYRLNHHRKPEHLQWGLPGEPARRSPLNASEVDARLAAFARLRADADRIAAALPIAKRDAFEELVGYPVRGSALANARYFLGERGQSEAAMAADAELREATRRFNTAVAGGKWRGFMRLEPADDEWRSMRLAAWRPPTGATPPAGTPTGLSASSVVLSRDGGHFTRRVDRSGVAWTTVPGLGRTGSAVTPLPADARSIDSPQIALHAARLEFDFTAAKAGEYTVHFYLLPSHPLLAGRGLRLAAAFDDQVPRELVAEVKDGSPAWAQGVLNASVTASTGLTLAAPGSHCLKVFMVDPGVVLDKVVIASGDLPRSYLGPPETR